MKMTWTRALIAAGCCTLALGFTACDDDDDKPTTTATTTTPTDTTTPSETTTPTDTTEEEVTPVTDQCTGAADLAIIQAANPDPADVAGACGLNVCINEPTNEEKFTCAQTCVVEGNENPPITGTGLTSGCAGCYAGAVLCAFQFCVSPGGECLQPDSTACAECREENGCNAAFYECSGLTPPAN